MTSLRRVAAWLVLVSFVAVQGAGLLEARHESLFDDAACLAESGVYLTGAHHAAGPQFERTIAGSPLEHCPICHLQRAMGNARPASARTVIAPLAQALRAPDNTRLLAAGVDSAFVPRGPPVSL